MGNREARMKSSKTGVLAVLVIAALFISGCASLCSVEMRGGKESSFRVVFSSNDIALIRNYYAKAKKTPPGLAKKEQLPPGLQKRVVTGQPLPPGLQGRGLPGDLESQLSILPS